MSEFEAFTNKGGLYLTARTASVTMNAHGNINFPGKVRTQVLGEANFVEYLTNTNENLLGFEGYNDPDNAPGHAYKISGDPEDSGLTTVERVLAEFGKRPPDEHTMFELQDRDGTPCIDVSDLPELEGNE